ncbi:transcription initiation factor TFIID subunit 4B isoform X7 [Dromaius novaehollandiae]|uniref:transcription initiation factor TFIID subunit 4B isoform X7 n=1 Tax=Dromaius novaehollandiae TaxID=8790 RepID=UPI00311EF785
MSASAAAPPRLMPGGAPEQTAAAPPASAAAGAAPPVGLLCGPAAGGPAPARGSAAASAPAAPPPRVAAALGGARAAAPPLVAPKGPPTATIQLPANFQLPPGTVLIRSSNGQLMLVSQQAIARAQSQPQNNTNVRPSVPTSTPAVRICAVQHAGTQLLKKVTAASVKTLSQTTNSVASTVQPPAVIQEAKIEPEEFTKKLYIELKSSPQPYLVPFLKKSMLALRQLMPNAQSFIQQCMQQPVPTQEAVSTCTSAAPTPSVAVATSAVATTSLLTVKPVSTSATVAASAVIKPVFSSASVTASLQAVKPILASAVVTASLQPASPVLTTTVATSGLTAIQTVKSVFTSAVATSSLQPVKPVLVSTVATSAPTPLQSLKPVMGTPISIKISQPNSIVAQSVGTQQVVKVKQLVVQQPSGTIVKQVSTLPQPSTLTFQTSSEKRMPLNTLVQTNQFPAGSILKQITLPGNKILSLQASPVQKNKIKENGTTSFSKDEDDINDVTSMAGVNLNEESACILATNSKLIGTVMRSCADEPFLSSEALQKKILNIGKRHDIMELNSDVVNLISHATQERLRGLLEKLTVIAQHRLSTHKGSDKYIISSDTRAQLRFLEKLDHLEKQRKDEEEREMLLRAAKSRSNKEDPEQLRLKQKAKEMQQLELAQMQQREANLTALAAIGPRKKRPLDSSNVGLEGLNGNGIAPGSSSFSLTKQLLRPRITRVCLRDLIFCMEQEREMKHSLALYRALLK